MTSSSRIQSIVSLTFDFSSHLIFQILDDDNTIIYASPHLSLENEITEQWEYNKIEFFLLLNKTIMELWINIYPKPNRVSWSRPNNHNKHKDITHLSVKWFYTFNIRLTTLKGSQPSFPKQDFLLYLCVCMYATYNYNCILTSSRYSNWVINRFHKP